MPPAKKPPATKVADAPEPEGRLYRVTVSEMADEIQHNGDRYRAHVTADSPAAACREAAKKAVAGGAGPVSRQATPRRGACRAADRQAAPQVRQAARRIGHGPARPRQLRGIPQPPLDQLTFEGT